MIFNDKLQIIGSELNTELDRLMDIAFHNQTHPSDLLLLHVNGFYNQDVVDRFNPHVIGPGREGYSEQTFYDFIHNYRTNNISELAQTEYLKQFEWSNERSQLIQQLTNEEAIGIQTELQIYMRFWEVDMIIKKLYQFVRLLNGESYDWYFKIQESARGEKYSGSKQDIIRIKIRAKLEDTSTIFYNAIKKSYITQVRNSIAHNNFSIIGRRINLNNYIEGDPHSSMHGLSFEEWANIFHNTLILHSLYIRLGNKINRIYGKIAMKSGNEIEIRITEQDGKEYPLILRYLPDRSDWTFKQKK